MTELTLTTWDEFERGLARVLRRAMVERTTLNLGVRADVPGPKTGLGFVQRETQNGALPPLIATVFGAGPEALRGADDAVRHPIEEAGWRPEAGHDSWGSTLASPATTAQYAALARSCVVWLQHVRGVDSPEVLGYHGWRDALLPYDGPEGELDPGLAVLYLPELGITREPPQRAGYPPAEVIPSADLVSVLDALVEQEWPLEWSVLERVAHERGWLPDASGQPAWWLPSEHVAWVSIQAVGDEKLVDRVFVRGNARVGDEADVRARAVDAWGMTCGRLEAWIGEPERAQGGPDPVAQWAYGNSLVTAGVPKDELMIVVGQVTL